MASSLQFDWINWSAAGSWLKAHAPQVVFVVVAVILVVAAGRVWFRKPRHPSTPVQLTWRVVALAGTIVCVVAWGATSWLLTEADSATDRGAARVDAIKTGLGIAAGTTGIFALLLSLRRQSHQERDATEKNVTELYTKASDLLGSSKAAVRLAGLYALDRLGQNNEDQRETIINVICSYLRMPVNAPGVLAEDATPEQHTRHEDQIQETQVRLAAQRILRNHITPGRREWPGLTIDLTGADLTNANFDDANFAFAKLADANFTGAILTHANLSRADLRKAHLAGANLVKANLAHATLASAILAHAKLKGACLTDANLIEGNLVHADLGHADLSGADLRKADLTGATLINARLLESDLTRVNFTGGIGLMVKLTKANLGQANLPRAALVQANLAGARLVEANLAGADLTQANLAGARLIEANLAGAKLIEANLAGATLAEANLAGANLAQANLSRADLRDVHLTGANLSQTNLIQANLSRADLRDVHLTGANLSLADLTEVALPEGFVL
ncbi:pentapeptide repeat-containing protein [Amycolatopsis sp. NPDC049253]|uniref:pentapeptide repeat-containing protein n=1 Tax=Amycolatopsis sp. NPDC049253 TaxID=3155274 RepID=UPI0034131D7F